MIQKIRIPLLSALCCTLFAGVAVAQTQQPAQMDAETQQRVAEIQQEFNELNNRLQAIENEAMLVAEVAEAYRNYRNVLAERMMAINPEAEDAIERREEIYSLVNEVRRGEKEPDDTEVQEAYAEFNQLQQQLSPIEQRAIRDEEVASVREDFREELNETMADLDDNTDELLSQRDELVEEYRNVVASAQGGQ
ncbi:MAG: hypothetical protein ACOC3I_08470 [Verrucomicrobiota bacterium]